MMKLQPSKIKGTLKVPPSKSYMQRAVAAALLAKGKSSLQNASFCEDAHASLRIARALGAEIILHDDSVEIQGRLSPKQKDIDCGEAGLSTRMFAPLAALLEQEIILQGRGSLLKRPMTMLEGPLKKLGASIKLNQGFLPAQIQGPLSGGEIEVDGSESSQFLSGLLLALPCASGPSRINVKELKSKPYIDMTCSVIEAFGVKIKREDYKCFEIAAPQTYQAREYRVEGDWSSAASILAAAAVCGELELADINPESLQADVKVLQALEAAGAKITFNQNTLYLKSGKLRPFNFEAEHCPDLFPVLTALAAHCPGISRISGVHRLKHKESNRALVLQQEWAPLGIKIEIDNQNDQLIIQGGTGKGGKISAHGDHRIAMAACVYACGLEKGEIELEGEDSVNKSYPEFFDDMQSIGVNINE